MKYKRKKITMTKIVVFTIAMISLSAIILTFGVIASAIAGYK